MTIITLDKSERRNRPTTFGIREIEPYDLFSVAMIDASPVSGQDAVSVEAPILPIGYDYKRTLDFLDQAKAKRLWRTTEEEFIRDLLVLGYSSIPLSRHETSSVDWDIFSRNGDGIDTAKRDREKIKTASRREFFMSLISSLPQMELNEGVIDPRRNLVEHLGGRMNIYQVPNQSILMLGSCSRDSFPIENGKLKFSGLKVMVPYFSRRGDLETRVENDPNFVFLMGLIDRMRQVGFKGVRKGVLIDITTDEEIVAALSSNGVRFLDLTKYEDRISGGNQLDLQHMPDLRKPENWWFARSPQTDMVRSILTVGYNE